MNGNLSLQRCCCCAVVIEQAWDCKRLQAIRRARNQQLAHFEVMSERSVSCLSHGCSSELTRLAWARICVDVQGPIDDFVFNCPEYLQMPPRPSFSPIPSLLHLRSVCCAAPLIACQ